MSLDQLFGQDASGAITVSVGYKPIFRLWDGAIQTAHQLRDFINFHGILYRLSLKYLP